MIPMQQHESHATINSELNYLFCYVWRGTQVVRERSAKPLCVGSIPTRASTLFAPRRLRVSGSCASWTSESSHNRRLQKRRRFAFLEALTPADDITRGYVIRFKSKSVCRSLSSLARHRRVTGRRSAQQPTFRCSSCRSRWTVPCNRKQWRAISYRCC